MEMKDNTQEGWVAGGAAGLGAIVALKMYLDSRKEEQTKARIKELMAQGYGPEESIRMAESGV
jgi:hypothetical protein